MLRMTHGNAIELHCCGRRIGPRWYPDLEDATTRREAGCACRRAIRLESRLECGEGVGRTTALAQPRESEGDHQMTTGREVELSRGV